MRLWVYLTLLGGIAGLAGFFLPLLDFTVPSTATATSTATSTATGTTIDGSVSAYQIIRGIDNVTDLMSGVGPLLTTSEGLPAWATSFNESMARFRTTLIAFFLPALLLALVGVLAGVRRRMGRLAGLLALAFGAGNAIIWYVFQEVSQRQTPAAMVASLGVGLNLLLVAGALGGLGGLGAFLVPDRGTVEE